MHRPPRSKPASPRSSCASSTKAHWEVGLETADVTFKRPDGTAVTLVSAVHIGEATYFKSLNDSFKKYDAVLFEMVKPKEGLLPGAPGAAEQAQGATTRSAKCNR